MPPSATKLQLPFLRDDYALLEAMVAIQEGRLAESLVGMGGAAGQNGTETWHDNSAFDIARSLSELWRGEEQKLRWYLAHAVIVEPPSDADCVAPGHMVRIEHLPRGFVEEAFVASYKRILPNPDDDQVVLSVGSGVGQALLGARPGEIRDVELREAGRFSPALGPRPGKVTRRFQVRLLDIWMP